jgi:hypothetical protein
MDPTYAATIAILRAILEAEMASTGNQYSVISIQ